MSGKGVNILLDKSSMFNPLVSIVIPVFNGGQYIAEAIESCLLQTYKSIEIIVVDDGSFDNTESICSAFGNTIKYYKKSNGGCASALNCAIKNASGDYISWLSHDDVYPTYKIEHQIKHISALRNKLTILYGPYELIDEESQVFAHVTPHLEHHPIDKLNISLYPLFKGVMNGCTMLIPKKCFDEVGYFDESLLATQDYDLWLKFLKVYPVAYVLKPMVKTRLHSEQGSKKIPTNLEECNRLWCHMIDSLNEREMLSIERTPFFFYERTASFLEVTPYKEAHQYCLNKKIEFVNGIKVSVIIPFKDRYDMLIEAIESVKSQTHQNIELILVDDGSESDYTLQFSNMSPEGAIRETVYLKQGNQGPAVARNLGVLYATGDYIAFLDSDDLFLPNKVRDQLTYMIEKQADFSYTSYDRLDLEGLQPLKSIDSGGALKKEFPELIINCPIATPTVMGKREIFVEHKFPTDYKIGEDVSCWLSVASENIIHGIPSSLTIVRTSSNSASIAHQKQVIGLLNIARHVASTKLIERYPEKLQELIEICGDYIKDNLSNIKQK